MCIPLIFGITTQLDVGGPDTITCPNCGAYGPERGPRNATSRECFEFCWVPLVPCGGKKEIAICPVCNWRAPKPKNLGASQQSPYKANEGMSVPPPAQHPPR